MRVFLDANDDGDFWGLFYFSLVHLDLVGMALNKGLISSELKLSIVWFLSADKDMFSYTYKEYNRYVCR